MKIGTDVVYIPRIKKLLEQEKSLKKVFHKSEYKDFRAEHIAGVFAVKEAFFKAIGKKVNWLEIEIKNKKTGKPLLIISDNLRDKFKIKDVDISISHDKDYAIAQVLIS